MHNALNLLNKTKEGETSLTKAKNDRKRFKLDLGEIKKKKQKEYIKWAKNALYNIEMLYNARNTVIEFYHDDSSVVPEAKHEATKVSEWTGLKILTPKQML